MHTKLKKVIDMNAIMSYILLFALPLYNYAQDCKSILEINTNKKDALIYIDDNLIGKGNIKIDVTQGNYFLHIRESSVKWNGYEVIDTIEIKLCNKEYLIEYNLFDNI